MFRLHFGLQKAFLLGLTVFIGSCEQKRILDPNPEITSIEPTSGFTGDQVVITGKNFGASREENEVEFNGARAEIKSVLENTIIVTVPAEATTGKITVLFSRQIGISDIDFTVL